MNAIPTIPSPTTTTWVRCPTAMIGAVSEYGSTQRGGEEIRAQVLGRAEGGELLRYHNRIRRDRPRRLVVGRNDLLNGQKGAKNARSLRGGDEDMKNEK